MKKFLLSFLVFGAITSNAQFIENFAYMGTGTPANDSLTNPAVTASKWRSHSGSTGQILMTTPGLTYAGYSGSGVGNAATVTHGSGSRQDINTAVGPYNFTTAFPNTDSSIYCSFLLTPLVSGGGASSPTGDYFFSFGATAGTNVTDLKSRLFIKDTAGFAGDCRIGFSKAGTGATAVYSTDKYPLNSTLLVVVKYKFVTGSGNDVTSVYIFTSGVPATEPVVPTITAGDNSGTDISATTGIASICLRQGSIGTGSVIVDGFRMHFNWNNAPLPVKLSSFNAIGLQNQVNLNWLTASEVNSESFVIERSIDGVNFSSINSVAAAGISTKATNYTYTDRSLPNTSTLYYRIKTISTTGAFEYSSTQKVSLRNVSLSISPNPASNQLLVNASNMIQNVELFDIMGKRVYTLQNNKTNSVRVDVSKLPTGNYMVKTLVDGESKTQQIAITH